MPPSNRHKRRKRSVDLQDFYAKKNESEVIVIEDTPPVDNSRNLYRSGHPSVNDNDSDTSLRHKPPGGNPEGYIYANGTIALATRGAKRNRKPPPAVYNPYKEPSPIVYAPVTKKRRKDHLAIKAPDQSAAHLTPQFAPPPPTPKDNGYLRYGKEFNTPVYPTNVSSDPYSIYPGTQYPKPVSSRDSYSSNVGKNSLIPPYDDEDGHYKVIPNDNLTNRYKIMRILGQGTFGKVVQCYDRITRTHVAIKIIRAIQKYRDASRIEIRVLNTLKDNDPLNMYKCIHMKECFDYRNHICIVSELYGMSVFDFLKENGFYPFPPSHIQSFAKQMLESVAFLHELRLVHTDLKPENILLVNTDYRDFPSKRNPTKMRKVLVDTEIRLIDFGSATFEDEYHSSVVSTRHYRAPEIILGLGWSYPCDLWSIGCILVEFYTGDALFQTHDNLEHLAMMEMVLGMFPSAMLSRVSKTCKYIKGGRVDYPNPSTQRQSRKYVRAMRSLSDIIPPTSKVNIEFLDLLKRLLTYEASERITAHEALEHPFFRTATDDEGTRASVGASVGPSMSTIAVANTMVSIGNQGSSHNAQTVS